jgi:glycerol-3-phosphate dehydrogenase
MSADTFTYDQGKITGVIAKDMLSGKTYTLKCKIIINATGVFADELMKKDDHTHTNIVSPSQGIHIVVDKKHYNSDKALLIPKTTDGRILFAVPWHQKVVIGTTDVKTHEIAIEPKATNEEIRFVIDADLVRDHSIAVSESGMITITGGKWTTYRKMARDAVNKALRTSELPFRRCKTRTIKLMFPTKQTQEHSKLLHPDFPYTEDNVRHAVQMEMACTLEDVLARRIRLLFLDVKVALEVAPKVGAIMQNKLGKDDVWLQDQIKVFSHLAKNYLPDNI